jgi:hypothetical protein
MIGAPSTTTFSEHLLELAASASPLVRRSLRDAPDACLADVVRSLGTPPAGAVQPSDDLWEVIGDHAAAHYGTELARTVVEEARADPLVPTSNHFGVDTFADSVQGTMLLALRPRPDGGRRRTVLVLGCGSVSLDNLTYPMGLRLYDPRGGDLRGLPQRLAVLPNRARRAAVAAAGPIDARMVARARSRLRKLHAAGEVTAFCERSAGRVLDEEFADPATLALPTYGDQGMRVNARLWERMLAPSHEPARLVQLQLESVTAALLASDLHDPASLVHRLFFDPVVCESVLVGLDRKRACWNLASLRLRLHDPVGGRRRRGGTVFFWGLTEAGRRIPLALERDGDDRRLAGIDEQGRRWEWPFSADGLVAGLLDGTLLPALFTCFTVLGFARGLVCVGGYYQVDYLPVMQSGVVKALLAGPDAGDGTADAVARVPTTVCLAGMQGVVRVLDDGAVIPAGPVEIVGAGGLGDADLARLGSVTVREAHLAAFAEMFRHVAPYERVPDDWVRRLATENATACPGLVRLEP